jgi:2-polyprenyl-3-methyl-5-hydroxy-6-metoxy-1,4-benzoquinol methylase
MKESSKGEPLAFERFDRIYQECVRVVLEHWTSEMQTEMALQCHSWGPELYDFRNYLTVSSRRFYRAYCSFAKSGTGQRVCDVGGFWGVFPMTLKELGFDVAMTESLKYYGDSFSALFECIAARGVRIFDYDPFEPGAALACERFDVVTVMAVLEHYPHSLKVFMENVTSLMSEDGRIYIEVPNIAYWPKRVGLLRGHTPLAQVAEIYRSDVPFIGHHHEFTIAELRELARLTGLSVLSEDFYNYTPGALPGFKMLVRSPLQFLAFTFLKDARECLAVLCQTKDERQ